MQGPVLKDGVLYTEQDSLPNGVSREGSMSERRPPHCLAAALREDWVGSALGGVGAAPASHPLHGSDEEEALVEEEYEGVYPSNASSDGFSDVEDSSGDTEVVFVKEGVAVCPTASRRQRIPGRLSLIKQYQCLFLCWLPYTAGAAQLDEGGASGVAEASSSSGRGGAPEAGGAGGSSSCNGAAANGTAAAEKDRSMYAVHPIPLSDIKALRKHTPTLGPHHVTLTLASGVSLPSFFFQNGGVKSFLSCLRQHACLVRSADDLNTYLVNDTADPLQRSLCSLELRDVRVGTRSGAAKLALSPLAGPPAAGQWQAAADGDTGLRAQLSELVDRFQQLTQSARDTASSIFTGSVLLGGPAAPLAPAGQGAAVAGPWAGSQATMAAPGAAAAAAVGRRPGQRVGGDEQQRRGSLEEASTSLGVFELVEGSAGWEGSGCWRERPRPPPLTLEELRTFYDSEGRLANPAGFRQRVHDGGVDPEARPEAWKLLLGVNAPGWGAVQRGREQEARLQQYRRYRLQWSTVDREQAARCSKWRERRTRVEKDVRRTDRAHRFYAHERSQAHDMLQSVLLTHERYNQDLGYVQGMSDLLAPILYIMRCGAARGSHEQLGREEALSVEAEAFWCFERLMRRMEANFNSDSRGMQAQLLALRSLLQLLDPQLYAHLEARDCLSLFFCYRWLLIHFKREFAFDEVLRLWEALWAGPPGLHLYLCVAVLMQHRRVILSEDWDFDGMLQWSVGLSGKLKLEALLRDAEKLATAAGTTGAEVLAGLTDGADGG